MAKRNISLQLTDDQVSELQAAFEDMSVTKPPALTADQLERITNIAVSAFIDLIAGRARHRSLTEQYLQWLDSIYSDVLTNEEPGERRLYTKLHFPYGQAQYLARVLREQHIGAWRRKALTQLKTALESRRAEAKEILKQGRGNEESMSFNITKGSRVELENILGSLCERGVQGISPIQSRGSMGSSIAVLIVVSNIEPILQEIERLLGGK